MISTQHIDDKVEIKVSLDRRPAIYLDQFAIDHFSRRLEDQNRFLAAFEHSGELLFSSVNLFEVGSLHGRSAANVRAFLERIDDHWVPIEYDAITVATAELENRGSDRASANVLSGSLLHILYDASSRRTDTVTLAAAVDAYQREDPQAHRDFLANAKAAAAQQVAEWRERYEKSGTTIDRTFPLITGLGPTLGVTSALMRVIVEESRSTTWMPNDAFDFLHAIVPLVYADAIFLDKQWKRRIARMNLPSSAARVFYGAEVPEFLDWFEAFGNSTP